MGGADADADRTLALQRDAKGCVMGPSTASSAGLPRTPTKRHALVPVLLSALAQVQLVMRSAAATAKALTRLCAIAGVSHARVRHLTRRRRQLRRHRWHSRPITSPRANGRRG